jgi:hypothetical protein
MLPKLRLSSVNRILCNLNFSNGGMNWKKHANGFSSSFIDHQEETPSRKAGDRVSSAEPKASQPTFLNGNPGFRNAFLSCLGSLCVRKAGRSPLGVPRRASHQE